MTSWLLLFKMVLHPCVQERTSALSGTVRAGLVRGLVADVGSLACFRVERCRVTVIFMGFLGHGAITKVNFEYVTHS